MNKRLLDSLGGVPLPVPCTVQLVMHIPYHIINGATICPFLPVIDLRACHDVKPGAGPSPRQGSGPSPRALAREFIRIFQTGFPRTPPRSPPRAAPGLPTHPFGPSAALRTVSPPPAGN